jgi:DNA-binding transcriptional ArsR family regulator
LSNANRLESGLDSIPYFHNHLNMELGDAVTSLAALAQETRLSIFRLLVEAGPEGVPAGQIGGALEVAPATLSFHLKELNRAGLVSSRQDGRFIYYAADFERMAALMTFLTQNCCQGMPQECLTVMETALTRCCQPAPKRKSARSKS